jgi:carbamate kinase
MTTDQKTIVVALGGNALQHGGESDALSQQKILRETAHMLVSLIGDGYKVAIVHGNGPQVGAIYLNEQAGAIMPLDTCVAMSQGEIGYWLQQAIQNELAAVGVKKNVVTMVTQMLVDEADPAFADPSKPIGEFYADESVAKAQGFPVKEDAGRGWRRVVPSPKPLEIIESGAVKAALEADSIVITAGGGGIPVVRSNGSIRGVEAVIDKDLSAAKVAETVGASILLILTAVEAVTVHYRQPNELPLGHIKADALQQYCDAGEFAPGSMLPKVQAAIQFAKAAPGNKTIITSPELALESLSSKAGTHVTA